MYTLMLGITIIVLGLALAPAALSIINLNMDEASCSAPTNDWNQALCFLNLPFIVL